MKRILSVVMLSVMMAAAGTAAESPKMLSNKEVKKLLATASTPEEHNKLAEHYRLKAEKFEAEANTHIEMAKLYRTRGGSAGPKWPASTFTTKHCEDLAKDLQKAAKEARSLSAVHSEMAKK
jgi:hypothetical protein